MESVLAVAEKILPAWELQTEPAPVSVADVRFLVAELRARDEALREARKQIEMLSTPDIIGIDDCAYHAETDFDGAADGHRYNEPVALDWANRTLGQWYMVNLVTAWDDEGDADECKISLFRSREDALAAIVQSQTSRSTSLARTEGGSVEPDGSGASR